MPQLFEKDLQKLEDAFHRTLIENHNFLLEVRSLLLQYHSSGRFTPGMTSSSSITSSSLAASSRLAFKSSIKSDLD